MVVPHSGVAHLHLSEPFLFGLTNGSTYFASYCRPPTRHVTSRPDRPPKEQGAHSQQPDRRRFKGFEFRASDYLVAAPCQSASGFHLDEQGGNALPALLSRTHQAAQ